MAEEYNKIVSAAYFPIAHAKLTRVRIFENYVIRFRESLSYRLIKRVATVPAHRREVNTFSFHDDFSICAKTWVGTRRQTPGFQVLGIIQLCVNNSHN